MTKTITRMTYPFQHSYLPGYNYKSDQAVFDQLKTAGTKTNIAANDNNHCRFKVLTRKVTEPNNFFKKVSLTNLFKDNNAKVANNNSMNSSAKGADRRLKDAFAKKLINQGYNLSSEIINAFNSFKSCEIIAASLNQHDLLNECQDNLLAELKCDGEAEIYVE